MKAVDRLIKKKTKSIQLSGEFPFMNLGFILIEHMKEISPVLQGVDNTYLQ